MKSALLDRTVRGLVELSKPNDMPRGLGTAAVRFFSNNHNFASRAAHFGRQMRAHRLPSVRLANSFSPVSALCSCTAPTP